jgi:hypothetical protein
LGADTTNLIQFDVLTAVTKKGMVFWLFRPFLAETDVFEEHIRLHLHGRRLPVATAEVYLM